MQPPLSPKSASRRPLAKPERKGSSGGGKKKVDLAGMGDNSIVYVCQVVGFCVFPGSQGAAVQGGSRTVRRSFAQFKKLLLQVSFHFNQIIKIKFCFIGLGRWRTERLARGHANPIPHTPYPSPTVAVT